MNEILKEIKHMKVGSISENDTLKKHNSYNIEGTIFAVVYPDDLEGLIKLLNYVRTNKIKHKILGRGSNTLFVCDHYDGIIIKLDKFNNLEVNDTVVTVGSGYNLMQLSLKMCRMGLSGLEFATGIPGSVGGAVYMNAGAYNSDMGYIVSEVKVITPELTIKTLYNNEMNFHYRTSFLKENPDYICIETKLVLKQGNKDAILDLVEERKKRRLMSQPLEFPSAGSVFRNPENDFAGRLIEVLGYKGMNIGGAKVSDKHANFIINNGGATGYEIKELITQIQDKVYEEFKVELKVEQEFLE